MQWSYRPPRTGRHRAQVTLKKLRSLATWDGKRSVQIKVTLLQARSGHHTGQVLWWLVRVGKASNSGLIRPIARKILEREIGEMPKAFELWLVSAITQFDCVFPRSWWEEDCTSAILGGFNAIDAVSTLICSALPGS